MTTIPLVASYGQHGTYFNPGPHGGGGHNGNTSWPTNTKSVERIINTNLLHFILRKVENFSKQKQYLPSLISWAVEVS